MVKICRAKSRVHAKRTGRQTRRQCRHSGTANICRIIPWRAARIYNRSYCLSRGWSRYRLTRRELVWLHTTRRADNNVYLHEHILEHILICYLWRMEKNEAVQQRRGWAPVNRRGKVPRSTTLDVNSNVEDKISHNRHRQWLVKEHNIISEVISGNWWFGTICQNNRLRVCIHDLLIAILYCTICVVRNELKEPLPSALIRPEQPNNVYVERHDWSWMTLDSSHRSRHKLSGMTVNYLQVASLFMSEMTVHYYRLYPWSMSETTFKLSTRKATKPLEKGYSRPIERQIALSVVQIDTQQNNCEMSLIFLEVHKAKELRHICELSRNMCSERLQ